MGNWNNNNNRNNNWNNNNNSNYGGNNRNQNNNNGGAPVKRSGAVYTKMKNGKFAGYICVNAWRKTSGGLMTAKAFPVDEKVHTSEKGNDFLRYAVEIAVPSAGTSQTYWCLMNTKTQKISIDELSLVISPNGSGFTSGGKRVTGFFGSNFQRRT